MRAGGGGQHSAGRTDVFFAGVFLALAGVASAVGGKYRWLSLRHPPDALLVGVLALPAFFGAAAFLVGVFLAVFLVGVFLAAFFTGVFFAALFLAGALCAGVASRTWKPRLSPAEPVARDTLPPGTAVTLPTAAPPFLATPASVLVMSAPPR